MFKSFTTYKKDTSIGRAPRVGDCRYRKWIPWGIQVFADGSVRARLPLKSYHLKKERTTTASNHHFLLVGRAVKLLGVGIPQGYNRAKSRMLASPDAPYVCI